MRCQTAGPSAIFDSAFHCVRVTYARLTCGPLTISSPISPICGAAVPAARAGETPAPQDTGPALFGNSSTSSIDRIGPLTMRITFQRISRNRWPTHTPPPRRVRAAVSPEHFAGRVRGDRQRLGGAVGRMDFAFRMDAGLHAAKPPRPESAHRPTVRGGSLAARRRAIRSSDRRDPKPPASQTPA